MAKARRVSQNKMSARSGSRNAASSAQAIVARANQVVAALVAEYHDAECALLYKTPLQLLVATILSAQCTDARVNMTTPELFRRYPDAAALARAPLREIERLIQSTGFFRNKAKNIQACCQQLIDNYGGEPPQSLEALVKLPGVGRKTANVLLGTAFGIPSGVVVDTHVGRISKRLGLTKSASPVQIEKDLMRILPEKEWIDFSHRLIHHGRRICAARKPACERCNMADFCPRVGVSAGPVQPTAKKHPSVLKRRQRVKT